MGHPVHTVMDCLCGETLGQCIPYMAEGGYWVVISTLAGTETNVMLRPLLTKGLHLVGSMLRKRSSEEKALLLKELVEKVWPKLEDGTIKPSIYKVLPITEAEAEKNASINAANAEYHKKVATATADVSEFNASVEASAADPDSYHYYKYLNAISNAYGKARLVIVGEGVDSSKIYFGNIGLLPTE